MRAKTGNPLYGRVRQILETAKFNIARSVNTTQVVANWLVGREIVEEEQRGKERADYGERLLQELSDRLGREFGNGYSVQNMRYIRQLYLAYPMLLVDSGIRHALRGELHSRTKPKISHGRPEKTFSLVQSSIHHAARGELALRPISGAIRRESWRPGRLHPNLSWTHYRTLLRVDNPEARNFYEIETLKSNWSARELERQINSLLYERLAMSRDKKGLLKLSRKGQEVSKPADIFKDPVVIEFLGLPESPKLVESELEQALIDNLQHFLMEMGTGFAFVDRQQRITLDGDHFYIDLVFYHTVLKCFVLIDVKVGKLTHKDLGQLELYVNYYDRERVTEGDQPTLGLILCTAKNDAVVRYTLGQGQQGKIFASRYKLMVPTEAELKAEIRRELRVFHGRKIT